MELSIPFKDATNGGETYEVGRFLDVKEPDGDALILDFNRCYNPLCNYSPAYNCPMPPLENILKIGIPAGENISLTNFPSLVLHFPLFHGGISEAVEAPAATRPLRLRLGKSGTRPGRPPALGRRARRGIATGGENETGEWGNGEPGSDGGNMKRT